MTITFETKVWEKDWRIILKSGRLEKTIDRCHYPFDKKVIFINNVANVQEVCRGAERLVAKSVIDNYIIVDEFAQKALDFFELSKESLGRGYYYSIAELVSIYLCSTKYLLHFSGDSLPESNSRNFWVNDLIGILDENPNIVVSNLTWNRKYNEAANESFKEIGNFYISYGFSDQMYLIRTSDFKNKIYNETNVKSNHYPAYGGELFEKRVHSWMQNQNKYRATYKNMSYKHRNFSKKPFVRKLNEWIDWR
jgi:hypothetical protein